MAKLLGGFKFFLLREVSAYGLVAISVASVKLQGSVQQYFVDLTKHSSAFEIIHIDDLTQWRASELQMVCPGSPQHPGHANDSDSTPILTS